MSENKEEKWEAMNLQILCAVLSNPNICEYHSLISEWQEKTNSGKIKITTGLDMLFDLVGDIAEEFEELYTVPKKTS